MIVFILLGVASLILFILVPVTYMYFDCFYTSTYTELYPGPVLRW